MGDRMKKKWLNLPIRQKVYLTFGAILFCYLFNGAVASVHLTSIMDAALAIENIEDSSSALTQGELRSQLIEANNRLHEITFSGQLWLGVATANRNNFIGYDRLFARERFQFLAVKMRSCDHRFDGR